jgi:hypothetical protein
MSRSDGRNPKFRVLCKRCNSYRHTVVTYHAIICTKCNNTANSFEEEFEEEADAS